MVFKDFVLYAAVALLVLTMLSAQSQRPFFRKCQNMFLLLFIAMLFLSFYLMGGAVNAPPMTAEIQEPAQDGGNAPASATAPRDSGSDKASAALADIPPGFLDVTVLHDVDVPIFSSAEAYPVLLSVSLPPDLRIKKIGDHARCFIGGEAEVALSSERIRIKPGRLVCRDLLGQAFEGQVNGFTLDADGVPGLKAKTVEGSAAEQRVIATTADLEEASRLLNIHIEGRRKSTGYPGAAHLVVNRNTVGTLLLTEGLHLSPSVASGR